MSREKPTKSEQQQSDMTRDSSILCCSQDFCCCCCSLFGLSSSIVNRFKYIFILSIGIGLCLLAIILPSFRKKVPAVQFFCNTTLSTTTCDRWFGYFAVYRLCFSLGLFHFTMSLLLIGVNSVPNQARGIFHTSFWPLKCLAVISLASAAFFIPNWSYFYQILVDLGMAGSFIFTIIEVLLLIDFAHHWSSDPHNKESAPGSPKCQNFALLVCGFVLYVVSLVFATLLYISYGSKKSCNTNQYFIIFNGCQCLVASLLSVLPTVKKAQANSGFLKSALVTTFTVFSTWLALSHGPRSTCNVKLNTSLSGQSGTHELSIQAISSSFLSLLVLIYEAISSGLQRSKPRILPFTSDKKNGSSVNKGDVESYNFSFFHFLMLLSCTHVMMNLTNWYVPRRNGMDFKPTWTAVLVKMISSAANVWVYIWTLLAPVLQSMFYSSIDEESPDQVQSSQQSAAGIRDQMKTFPSHSDPIPIQGKDVTNLNNIPVHSISNNNEGVVKVSHGSMSRKSSLRSLSPKSDTEREMLRLQNKVITLQEKIAKLQTKVATLQGSNI